MVTGVDTATAVVVTVKFAVVAPDATTTVAGVVVTALLSESVTVLCAAVPAAGAFNVTVPVEGPPPPIAIGFIATDARTTGLMVSVAAGVEPS